MVYVIQVCWQLASKLSASLYVLLFVQWKTPDGGQRKCQKHAEFYSKNKFDTLVHLVGLVLRISGKYVPCKCRPQYNDFTFNQQLIITSYKSLSTVNICDNNERTLQPQSWTEKERKRNRIDSCKCSWSALGVSNVATSCFMFTVVLNVFLSSTQVFTRH